jgi:hypothetical protein
MLVTRKPRKGKKHKILWSEETLRDQLWWLKPQRKVKQEVKEEVKEAPVIVPSRGPSSSSPPRNPSLPPTSAAPSHLLEILVKIEPNNEDDTC